MEATFPKEIILNFKNIQKYLNYRRITDEWLNYLHKYLNYQEAMHWDLWNCPLEKLKTTQVGKTSKMQNPKNLQVLGGEGVEYLSIVWIKSVSDLPNVLMISS